VSCSRKIGILACVFLLAGCSKKPPAFQRVAVLPFENLAADPGLDWMSRGLTEAVLLGMSGSPQTQAFLVPSLREAPGARPTRILHGYYVRRGAGLRVEALLEEAGSGRMVKRVAAAGPVGAGAAPLAQALVAELDGRAPPAPAPAEAALRAYVEGLQAPDRPSAAQAFERAVRADAGFGPAYVAWAQRLAAEGDPSGAREVISRAREAGGRIQPRERARLADLVAALDGDRAAQYRALLDLAQAAPADPDVFRRLGSVETLLRRYPDAVASYRKALERDPDNVVLLNQLGYAQAYARDLAGAAGTLERYRAQRPEEANPSDSLGDVHYYLGRFREAAGHYLEAIRKDPWFLGGGTLWKAAWARLMAGEVSAANELCQKYVQLRKAGGDSLAELRQGEWEYLTGRRGQAVTRLERLARGPAASLACSQLVIWSLNAGDRERAQRYVHCATAGARDPAAAMLARTCQFLAQPAAPADEWTARAERFFPGPTEATLRRSALAHALLLAGQFAAALAPLKELHGQTPASSPEPVNVLLAWALIEAGRFAEAGPLLETYPLPEPAFQQPFSCLSFPRLFRLRGVLLEKQGRRAEATASFRLYEELGGAGRS